MTSAADTAPADNSIRNTFPMLKARSDLMPAAAAKQLDHAVETLTETGLDPVLARLFATRGVTSAADLDYSKSALLPPDTLKNAIPTGRALAECLGKQARLVIVSDYDCDGATACAVLVRTFRAAGMNFGWLVPDREIHGYGLSPAIVEEAGNGVVTSDVASLLEREQAVAKESERKARISPTSPTTEAFDGTVKAPARGQKPQVLITVDNGIASVEGVAKAREMGMNVLITDHHLPGATRPDAWQIVNPNQEGCGFASKNLAGCGVAYYVACTFAHEVRQRLQDGRLSYVSEGGVVADEFQWFHPDELLPLVSLGTVADVVQLDHNNRALVTLGLDMLRSGMAPVGLAALAQASGVALPDLSCQDYGFKLGPRLNAAGRISHMGIGIDCLVSDNREYVRLAASALTHLNEDRKTRQKAIEEESVGQVLEQLRESFLHSEGLSSLVAYSPEWHKGIVGIVAGRIKEAENRPVFVLTAGKDDTLTGSGRSIPGFHLKHALDQISAQHPDMFKAFGGHAMAAGVTLNPGMLDRFRHAFEAQARKDLSAEDLIKAVVVDGELPPEAFTEDTAKLLEQQVWGQGFPPPMFTGEFQVAACSRMGADQSHLRIGLLPTSRAEDGTSAVSGQSVSAVKFSDTHWNPEKGEQVELVYQLTLNRFRNRTSMQLLAEAGRNAPAPVLSHEVDQPVQPDQSQPAAPIPVTAAPVSIAPPPSTPTDTPQAPQYMPRPWRAAAPSPTRTRRASPL